VLEAPDGRVTVRDLSRPGARLVEISLPDGRTVGLAEHLCGWTRRGAGEGESPLWATVSDAVEALTGRTRDGEPWIAVLEEFATELSGPPAEPLLPGLEERLAELAARSPGLYADGPRAHHSGGWYMFIGGLPGGEWIMEYGATPEAAALAALARADRAVEPG
jgi:hypothetical protein